MQKSTRSGAPSVAGVSCLYDSSIDCVVHRINERRGVIVIRPNGKSDRFYAAETVRNGFGHLLLSAILFEVESLLCDLVPS